MHSENSDRSYELYIETPDGTYVLLKEDFKAFKDIVISQDYTLDVLDLVNAVIIMNEV
jgi:hypothetical protein